MQTTRGETYQQMVVDPISIMKECFSKEELIGFYKGNILKYMMRVGKKEGTDDEYKMYDYMCRLIELKQKIDEEEYYGHGAGDDEPRSSLAPYAD